MDKDEFDVSEYSDRELFVLMDLDDPSDRVLEAKILQLLDKYENIDNKMGHKFLTFFEDVYNHFFGDAGDDEEEDIIEGFTPTTAVVAEIEPISTIPPKSTATDTTNVTQKSFSKGLLNPLLKESIKRIVIIDSQYRDTSVYPISTAFTFNLSETLVDCVSLKLYSVQIPYTWYTISNDFGSNFFYLKGNSPGINQGNFDYQLSILAGNYQAVDFQNSINTAFSNNIFAVNPDVSFGLTGVSYNSINAKLTTTIDIQNLYNETKYNLVFPNFPSYGIDASNVLSIPQLLGYKNTVYTPCSIFSSTSTIYPVNNYTITSNNNTITIYLYQSQMSSNKIEEYATLGTKSIVSTITIVSTLLGSYSPAAIISDIQNQISLNSYLITNKSSLQYSNEKFEFSFLLNRKKVANEINLKSIVYFQEDASHNSLWTGLTSLFQFDSSYNELNNILSETTNVTTTYVIGSSPNITLTCINPYYYDISSNNQIIDVSNSTYNSIQYLTAINNGMQQLASQTNNNFNCWIDISNSLMVPTISCDISNSIPFLDNSFNLTSNNFLLDISSSILHTICHFPTQINKPTTTSSFLLQAGGYSIDNNSNFFKVYCTGPRNKNVPENVITISSTNFFFEYLENMFDAINNSFQMDMSNNVDLSQSKITYTLSIDGIVTCTLNLNIYAKLTSNDYKISLYDAGYNSWHDYLGFQYTSYNLNLTNSQVSSINPFYTNELLLTSLNNSFTINPVFDASGGVYTTNNSYQITKTLTLPVNISYTKEVIVANINLILQQDTLTKGSYVDISQSITKIRVNVNKIFTAQDYRLVFFDNTFTHCNYGYPSSIENVKWDTTIGWVLGYRNSAEYVLTSKYLSNNGTNTYYDTYTNQVYTVGATNIVKLTGYTSINVNLYNYVMIILDDYCQNHLNDGLVTITKQDYDIPLPSYANRSTYKCDPTTGNYSIANTGQVNYNNLTANQIYSANQILNTQTIKQSQNIYSPGPYVQDIFGLVPIKTAGLQAGQSFIEFGGTLQNQERSYFGPVNISKMSIQLLNDKGTVLDLNNANWSFSFLVEMLYNPERG